jgi:hypothetical protein
MKKELTGIRLTSNEYLMGFTNLMRNFWPHELFEICDYTPKMVTTSTTSGVLL